LKVADHQLDEILDFVSKADDVKNALSVACKANPLVKFYIHLACSDQWIDFDLEDLNYKFSDFHRSLCGAYLLSRSSKDIMTEIIFSEKIAKKTKYFHTKNLLELLSAPEAKVFEAILKKNLPELYPTITHQIMVELE
jgi:hypothetical protein